MAEFNENQERAESLFEAGYYKEEKKGLIESIIEIGEDRVEEAREFYNKNCTGGTQKEITREEAEEMLGEYNSKKKEWVQARSSDGSSDGSLIGGILGIIFAILLIVIWLGIRYVKLLIATYKQAKIVDAMELRNIAPELEDKCASYREALKDLKTCPKRIKALAGTNNIMPAAGAVYVILSLFNFVVYYIQHESSMLAPFVILFAMQLVLGAALMARHKFSAGILFGLQSLFGVLIMSFGYLVPYGLGNMRNMFWNLSDYSRGINGVGVAVVALFVVLTFAMTIYYMSNVKNKIVESIIYIGFIGCRLFAHTNIDLAKRLELRTHRFESNGVVVLSVLMLELAWFVIVFLMLKGKKKISVTE